MFIVTEERENLVMTSNWALGNTINNKNKYLNSSDTFKYR